MAELTEKYGDKQRLEIELIPSGGGVFEVALDGKLIFSKKESKRFPAYQEIPHAIDMELIGR